MTEQDAREILRLARMDVSEALSHPGTGQRVRLEKIGQEAMRSIVLGLHLDLESTLAFTLAHSLLKALGKLDEAEYPPAGRSDLTALLQRKLGVTGTAEMALLMGAISEEQRSIILELNALRNKYAHEECPSTRDGSSLCYRGHPLEDPENLKRLIGDVNAVMSKLRELLSTGEVDEDVPDEVTPGQDAPVIPGTQ
jgi:hypothetical protein